MFTKAFRALSSGSRDRDDPYLDRPSSGRRPPGPETAQRQLQEPITFDSLRISESDSDEYGLPQIRKSSISGQDTHKRTLSREQAEIEYKCPGCGEHSRLKPSEYWAPCKYCHVKPLDPRRRPNTRPAAGQAAHKQIKTPRQLEDSFRSMYKRLGLIIHDEGLERSLQIGTNGQSIGAGNNPSPSLHGHDGQAASPGKAVIGKSPTITLSTFVQQAPVLPHGPAKSPDFRTPPGREPPSAPSRQTQHHGPQAPNSSLRADHGTHTTHGYSHRTQREPSRPVSRGSPKPLQTNPATSPRKRLLREPHPTNGARPHRSPSDPKSRAKQQLIEHFQAEFRSLYGNAEFLNSTYCSSIRPKLSKRSLSEGSNVSLKSHEEGAVRPSLPHQGSVRTPTRKVDISKPLPAAPMLGPLLPDSKVLLAGHLHDIVSSLADHSEGRSIERSSTVTRKSTYQTSPHVNYSELHAYHSALTRYTLDVEYCLTLVNRSDDGPEKRKSNKNEIVQFMANLLVGCFEVMLDLLTAAREDPIAPQDARYLVLVLATPWLLRPLTPLASEFQGRHNEQLSQGLQEPNGRYDEQARLLLLDQQPGKKPKYSIREHILSLLMGRISNLPDTVQHVFARWFSNMPVNVYVEVMKAVQDFNLTYIRQIPVQQHQRTEETKRLHERRVLSEMLGGVNIENFGDDADTLPWYSKRKGAWKLRVSCQALQLLVVANDIKCDVLARYGQTRPSDDRYRPFSVDAFYTPLLDPAAGRLDVAMDFELWDARKGKFTMCQYPFLLTLGTKVKILEYDNERRKKDAVRHEWHASKGMSADPYFHLPVRRDHIIADSFKLIREAVGSLSGVTMKKLRVHFEGEEAVDAGGPKKEWFLILTQELFNPDLGLFYLSDSGHFWFHSSCNLPNEYFELVGAVFGLAIYNQTSLFAPFPPFLFKKLAAAAPRAIGAGISWRHMWRPTLQDYAELSPEFARVLEQGLADPSIMEGLTFEIPMFQNGQSVYQPLMPGGSEKEITPANINEYVEKAVTWVLRDSIKNQFTAFARGFHAICGGNALSLFRGEELELLVRGSEDFDLDTLRASVQYDNWKRPGTEDDLQSEDDVKKNYPVVRMFWDYFEQANIRERRRILRFITGTDRLPPAGIVNLVIKVSRQQMDKDEFRYPSARTCFNQILLPDCFRKQAVFNKVFRNALDMAGTGFGMK